MIISHDRQTLFIGVPKNGSQTARAVLGQIGVDLVGEMGRHPTVPEAIRLAEACFGAAIAPTAIYAFWRDPVERFCSAVEFHRRCLPNSFIQLFPERFDGIEPHPRWFESDPEAIAQDLRTVIESISPLDILAVLPPPSVPGATFQPRGGNLSFYRPQSQWADHPDIIVLSFPDYGVGLREVVDQFGGDGALVEIPQVNAAADPLPVLGTDAAEIVRAYYTADLRL
ncbi:hypothetical protein [Porphyrobacter sp. LM 6]|uniref:hypothetical protein n=1 Tax=Porphyrobacter sp. LM 6 TaxID=1896196 RepID=UPI0008472553|nr:hypothetical protein [Porphyrobacter sp. LM 6]AOL93998.1 hypothetical protein BG023_111060 [Porphyrobacter sp. LM 6]